jgi:hypothetical protein
MRCLRRWGLSDKVIVKNEITFFEKVGNYSMSISTWDLLKSFGFMEDTDIISDPPGGLSIDFGNFKLSVIFCTNRWVQEVAKLSGIMSTSRTIAMVEDEMPREFESWEQGVAWITWCLDKSAPNGIFSPSKPIGWLTKGRQNFHLLPWERERVAYENRPTCQVQREWARIALRNLSEQIETAENDVSVVFWFDGEIFTIRCASSIIAVPASGKKWPCRYLLKTGTLRRLPKRLMDMVEFSVWESSLSIGNHCYKDVTVVESS